MTEQKSEKKVASRTVAIALAIICIILVVSLVGAIAGYTSIIRGKDNTITTITNQKNQLQTYLNGNATLLNQTQKWLLGNITAYDNYVNDHSYADEQYLGLETQYNALLFQYSSYVDGHSYWNEQYQNLTNILDLANSTTWVNNQTVSQPMNSSTSWTFSASYAGYLLIQVDVRPMVVNGTIVIDTGLLEGIYVRVNYTYGASVFYDQQSNLTGIGMTASFEVLPTNIGITVGNTKSTNGATETVTITYYY